jgi:signal transduction histidine kinase/CheY-like chemotaxis protein
LADPSRRGFKWAVGLTAALALAILVGVRALDLRSQRDDQLQSGDRRAANLAVVLTGYLGQTFAAVDASLRQLALHSQHIGGAEAAETEWGPALVAARAALRVVGSISVVDSVGIIRHSTQPAIVGQSRSGQYVVRRLASDTTDDVVADTPFRTVAGRIQYMIPLGRRLSGPGGAFRGLLVATFIPDELREVFRSADVGAAGVVTVFHRDGFIVFREPSGNNPIGEVATTQPLFEAALKTGGNGAYRGPAEANGPIFRTAFRALPSRDLIVAVSLREDELLSDWRRDVAVTVVRVVVFGITLAVILGLTFREMNTRLAAQEALSRSQRLESIGRLTGGIAHDFNNLLTVILGNVALIKDGIGPNTPKTTEESTAQIERAATRGTALIRQLLAFARRQPLQPRTVDIGTLVRDAKPMLDRVLGEDVTLQTDNARDPGPLLATVDPVGAESTLLNLCINARDAMPDGGTIKIHLARVMVGASDARANPDMVAGSYVVISVTDTGSGIPEEILPHLFEPFFTTKDVGRGTGLGLSMVYGFVKQSGGFVKVDSVVGRGTTVTLFFPEATGAAPAPARVAPDEMPRGNGETILLVEDEPDLLALAERFLKGLGYRVLPAASAAAAIDVAAQEARIDMLLTDIVMTGGMNGRQLAAELREKRPRLSVLFMSGHSDDVAERRVARFGEAAIIAKPYERSALAIAVRDALRPGRQASP